MADNTGDLKMGVITLDQQENSPYLPYIQLNLNAITQFMDMLKTNPKIDPEALRPYLKALVKLDPKKVESDKILNALTDFNAASQLEQKLLLKGISKKEYDSNPEKKKIVDGVELDDTQIKNALRNAMLDQFGLYIQDYIGPNFDVGGHKMGIIVATIRNDMEMLLPTKYLSEDERNRLRIKTWENVMQDKFYPESDLTVEGALEKFSKKVVEEVKPEGA